MRRPIDPAAITRLMDQGMSPPEIAKHLNVNRTSVYRVIKDLKKHAPKVLALEKADRYVDHQLNLMDQYRDSVKSLKRLRDGLEAYVYEGNRTVFVAMQKKTESESIENDAPNEGKDPQNKALSKSSKSKIEKKTWCTPS